jgi:hypothetical protein
VTDPAESPEPLTPTSEPVASVETEKERDPADELQHNLPIDHQVASGSIFNGTTNVGTMNVGSAGPSVLTWWPLRDEFATSPPSFVEPPNFEELRRLIDEHHVVLLTGSGCGSVSAAGSALRAAGHHPIVELPASPTTQELLAAVQQISTTKRTAGILVPSLGEDALRGFGAAELRRLHGALGPNASVIFTTRAQLVPGAPTHVLPTLEATAPDAAEVIRGRVPADADVRERALAALALLPVDTLAGPGTAVALVDAARASADASPEQLASVISGQSEALDEWLAERPTAEHVAWLTAAVTLDGVPSADVDAEALALHHLVEGELEPSSEPKRFGSADRGWPAGVVTLCRRPLGTYFGVQETEVVEICPPHRREWLFAQLWDRLGADFRTAYIQWLCALAEHPSPRVRSGGAVTAGMLFAKEPATAERELLRPWALDGRLTLCECAGLAIGIPVLLGNDPASARALAYSWSEPRSGVKRRRAAIAAYGGPLGAWDNGSAAPAHLWRIPDEPRRAPDDEDERRAAERMQLRHAADNALASLVAAGAEAGQVRATVIGLLSSQADERQERQRAYELLPKVLHRLTRGDEMGRASLAALLDDAEQASFVELTTLLARAFDVPSGFASARAALLVLLDAHGTGWIDQDIMNKIIRAMKAGTRPGRLPALGKQIERVLAVERRDDGARGRAARDVYSTFFSTPQGGAVIHAR